jgi:hypothetical protein
MDQKLRVSIPICDAGADTLDGLGMVHSELSVQILQVSFVIVVVCINRRRLPQAVPKRSYDDLERK